MARARRAEARPRRRHGLSRHQLLGARQGRPRLRAGLARSAGRADPARRADRPAARQARSRRRQGQLRGRPHRRSRRGAGARARQGRRASTPAASTPPASARRSTTCSARELGPGAYRTRVIYNDIYFNDGVYLKLTQNPKAMDAVLETIRKAEGVWRVYRKEALSATDPLTRPSSSATTRAAAATSRCSAAPTGSPRRAPTHAWHRPSLRHARAGDAVWSGSRRASISSRPRRSTSRRRWRS